MTRIAALLALLLAFSAGAWRIHVKADQAGYARAQGEQSAIALQASETRRMQERALSLDNERVTNAYIAEKSRRALVDADTASRLRDYQAALDSATSANTAARSGITATLAEIASQCSKELAALDGYAGRLSSIAGALQNYAASVRLIVEKE